MAILGKIRQRSFFLILVIGMALFAFVISGVFNTDSPTGAVENIGAVNGEDIPYAPFSSQVEGLQRAYGGRISNMDVVERVWDQTVRNTILSQQFDELGITIGEEQLIETLATTPGFMDDPTFQNEAGLFDADIYRSWLATTKDDDPQLYAQIEFRQQSIAEGAKENVYFNLAKAGMGATFKEGELEYHLENDKVSLNYVQIPYTSIPDSTVTVSDDDIEKYIKENKEDFKVTESRDIQFVLFEEKPSEEDKEEVRKALEKMIDDRVEYNNVSKLTDTIPGLVNADNPGEFVDDNSEEKFSDKYLFKTQLPATYKEVLFEVAQGEVYGPYLDNDIYKISLIMDSKEITDSVKSSHIIVPYVGSFRAGPSITDTKEQAKKKIDSLYRIVRRSPRRFEEIADAVNSDGTKGKGGDIGWTLYSNINDDSFDRDFSDFIFFDNRIGKMDIVETKFGYHIIRVDDKGKKARAVKFATVTRKVLASEKTVGTLFTEATRFLSDVTEGASFVDKAKENNYLVRPVKNLGVLDANIPGLPNQRKIVRWAFNEDTKIGDVDRFTVDNGFVVAQLTEKTPEGYVSASEGSARVLPVLRKKKKAQIIMANAKETDLSSLATANNVTVRSANAVTLKSPLLSNREPKVVGAAFAMAEGETSTLLEGEEGVYMIEVNKLEVAPAIDSYASYSNKLLTDRRSNVNTKVYDALKERAEIEDNRKEVY